MLINNKKLRLVLAVLVFSLLTAPLFARTPLATGQSSTLLPDGTTLRLGGVNSQAETLRDALLSASPESNPRKLENGLNFPRSGHTATVLPDGTVFIFGGVGPDGKLVTTSELFDPATQKFTVLTDVLAVPRAFHTAVVLTDGSLLLAGGITAGNQFPDDVQILDFRSRRALSFHALLSIPREGHVAALLSDGSVRISGGTDHFGRPVAAGELYDPASKRFRFIGQGEDQHLSDDSGPTRIAASIPEDGTANVSILPLLSIRFSQLLDVRSANTTNFVLVGPNDKPVPAKVSAAEDGRLVFVTPNSALTPGTHYILRIKGAISLGGEHLPELSISFDTDGEAPEPIGPDFFPNASSTTGPSTTKWQQLPALQAAPGTTALAGQVLKLNGWPLENTTLEINGRRVRTDSTGRFLLQGLAPGHHVLWIDGSTANHDQAAYGLYEVGTTILPNKTNVLNYTIWMTRLDMAHAVRVPSPTSTEAVITNPLLPGLELHLPAHTVITDRNGKPVRQISITPIPIDKPPFPLPAGVQVPIYFTIQPGGAYIKVANSAAGARLIYPNGFNFRPGTEFEFWNYDADAKGWHIYGNGTVSPDARNVVPDPGVFIYEFTGAMVGVTGSASTIGSLSGGFVGKSDPVDIATGQFVYTKTDLALPDILPIALTRTYIANDSRSRSFGIGTTNSYDILMVGDTNPWTYQELILADGARIRFDRISSGTGFADATYVHTSSRGAFYGAVITRKSVGWTLTLKDGTKYDLPEAFQQTKPFCQAIIGITDRFGNHITLDRDTVNNCQLTKITSSNGRFITLAHDAQGRITQATDNIGRNVFYTYDAAGRLSTVTDANSGVTTYTYDDQNRMLTIRDARNIVYLTNQYDSAGRVIQQTEADTGTYLFAWTPTANPAQTRFYTNDPNPGAVGGSAILRNGCWNGFTLNRYSSSCGQGYMPLVAQVDVTDPRGYVERVVFNSAGYKTSDTHALGQPEQQTETYSYYSDNLLQSETDSLGRVTSFDYDAKGNLSRVTRLDGTPSAVTTTFAYEPSFNHLQTVTDPLAHSTSITYDAIGEPASITDPLNHQITTTFNGLGQMLTLADPLGNTSHFDYFGGDLVRVTDPAGNGSTMNYDLAGRLIASLDPQGNTTRYQYNNLNLVTQATDPRGNNTTFSYDPNGNLLSLTDAANHTTSYTYDNMDRVLTRTDPLLRQESYSYDLSGNLVSSTDRKSQVTSLTYDPLDRLKLVGYNTVVNGGNTTYESTIGYTYDAGNRMTQAVDSAGGTITEGYDNLNRLTTETTAQGSISYGYDLAGRRVSMTVGGQPQVTYSYDNANRLTQIAQGTATVGFSYDTADRRSTLTLSNGVNMSYTYDNDSRVTGITYKFNTNTLGNLAYSYDTLGRRTQVSGNFARTGLPAIVASATYDAANELTNWNGTPISYDLNGNMLSDGTNTFSWNARDQVAALNSVSLQYDGFGRRTKNLQNTSFLFDGANAVQELSGSTATANLISGSIDEIFTRSDSSGAFTPLKDALGSTLVLVDANGNLVTQYTYDPFGNTSVFGASSSNGFQYTGRENESNGLYFYRARYYSPLFGRFISEDPLGFGGSGVNFYAYASDDPINFIDPFGLTDTGTITGPTEAEIAAAVSSAAKQMAKYGSRGGRAGLAGFLVVLDGFLAYEDYQAVKDFNAENAAYADELTAIAKLNAVLLAHPRPVPSLAGRYTLGSFSGGDDDDECKKEWKKAGDFCSQLDDLRTNDPIEFRKWKNIFGPNIQSCMKGQVSERCGGHKI
jgi:RHS repeat-associated protein